MEILTVLASELEDCVGVVLDYVPRQDLLAYYDHESPAIQRAVRNRVWWFALSIYKTVESSLDDKDLKYMLLRLRANPADGIFLPSFWLSCAANRDALGWHCNDLHSMINGKHKVFDGMYFDGGNVNIGPDNMSVQALAHLPNRDAPIEFMEGTLGSLLLPAAVEAYCRARSKLADGLYGINNFKRDARFTSTMCDYEDDDDDIASEHSADSTSTEGDDDSTSTEGDTDSTSTEGDTDSDLSDGDIHYTDDCLEYDYVCDIFGIDPAPWNALKKMKRRLRVRAIRAAEKLHFIKTNARVRVMLPALFATCTAPYRFRLG